MSEQCKHKNIISDDLVKIGSDFLEPCTYTETVCIIPYIWCFEVTKQGLKKCADYNRVIKYTILDTCTHCSKSGGIQTETIPAGKICGDCGDGTSPPP